METLPQIETLPCDQCPAPIDIVEADPWRESGDLADDDLDLLCPECTKRLAPADAHHLLDQRLSAWRHERELLGNPPGTLWVFVEYLNGGFEQPTFVFAAVFFQVYVDRWDSAWAPLVIGGGPPFMVILGAYIEVDPETGFLANLRWSWQRPDLPPITEMHNLLPFTTAKSTRLLEALRAFHDYGARGPGKPKGKFKRPRDWYLNRLREHARVLRREPTEQEFCNRYCIDRKTLRRNLRGYGLWPWEEFLHRGLHSSQARTIKV